MHAKFHGWMSWMLPTKHIITYQHQTFTSTLSLPAKYWHAHHPHHDCHFTTPCCAKLPLSFKRQVEAGEAEARDCSLEPWDQKLEHWHSTYIWHDNTLETKSMTITTVQVQPSLGPPLHWHQVAFWSHSAWLLQPNVKSGWLGAYPTFLAGRWIRIRHSWNLSPK